MYTFHNQLVHLCLLPSCMTLIPCDSLSLKLRLVAQYQQGASLSSTMKHWIQCVWQVTFFFNKDTSSQQANKQHHDSSSEEDAQELPIAGDHHMLLDRVSRLTAHWQQLSQQQAGNTVCILTGDSVAANGAA